MIKTICFSIGGDAIWLPDKRQARRSVVMLFLTHSLNKNSVRPEVSLGSLLIKYRLHPSSLYIVLRLGHGKIIHSYNSDVSNLPPIFMSFLLFKMEYSNIYLAWCPSRDIGSERIGTTIHPIGHGS